MNTAKSVWLGWGSLMVAGAGAYYFAKRDINAYRKEQELKGNRPTEYLECASSFFSSHPDRHALLGSAMPGSAMRMIKTWF